MRPRLTLRLTRVTRDLNDDPFRCADSIKALSNELSLEDGISVLAIKFVCSALPEHYIIFIS